MRRAPSPNGLSVALPRKRLSSGCIDTAPHEATSPSRRVSTSPLTWITTSFGPMAKPPVRSAGIARRDEDVNSAIVPGVGPASAAASAGEAACGCDGSGTFGTMRPIGVDSARGATGGAGAIPGDVATQRVPTGGVGSCCASIKPAGFAISSVSRFFAAGRDVSTAGWNGLSPASASAAPCATSRMGDCCSACDIRSAIASLPALRNQSRARASSPFCASARPR